MDFEASLFLKEVDVEDGLGAIEGLVDIETAKWRPFTHETTETFDNSSKKVVEEIVPEEIPVPKPMPKIDP